MAVFGQAEYHAFAVFAGLPKAEPIGTTTELRSGIWYNGRLLEAPTLGASFGSGTGMQRAADFTLRIADPAGGEYRTAAQDGSLLGTEVTVTLVMRVRNPDGTIAETVRSQRCTVGGLVTTRAEVQVQCTDLEATKFDKLYPDRTWRAVDWPQLLDADAGRPIAYPVGTALKIPCPQIIADPSRNEWMYGVCTGTPKLLSIVSVSSLLQRVTVSTDITDVIEPGQVVYLSGTSAADGRYVVDAIVSSTVFRVTSAIPASTGGSVRCMPHVRTVYRAGRVVDPSEYSIIHVAAMPSLTNGDFTSGLAGWIVSSSGTGTATAAGGKATITANGAANYAYIQQTITPTLSRDLNYLIALDVDAASTARVRISGDNVAVVKHVTGTGRRAALMSKIATGVTSVNLRPEDYIGSITIDNVAVGSTDLVVVVFSRPQVDFQGNTYALQADVRGVDSRNAASEVQRLLASLGLSTDASSIAAAAGVATANRMLVDCDYGRGGQRTVRAIVEDHLFLLRGALTRDANGYYGIRQDTAAAVVATLDESLGDSVDVDRSQWDGRPSKVSLKYRPSARDPGSLQETIDRAVAGGLLGEEPTRNLPYVRDHETADRLLSYLAARRAASGRCTATVYRQQFELSQVLSLTSPLNWGAAARNWMVRDVQRTPNANKLDLIEYDAAVYTYVPSATLPVDANPLGYEPDYSQTPPATPIWLSILSTGIALAPDGTSSARVSVRAMPPSINWSQIWFVAIHDVTGEVQLAQGSAIGGGYYGTTLGSLRAGNVYQLKAYAVNSVNVQGALQGTFDATAIGGSAAATTFTTPGYATLPPNVASCSAQQGTGRIVQVTWPAVSLSADVLGDYRLERNLAGGGWVEVWRGRATGYTDRDFSQYGQSVQYRVRASDRWGNVSAGYATSNSFSLSASIYGGSGSFGDITSGTVGTVNRTGVTLIGVTINGTGLSGGFSFAHGIGKVPMASVVGIDSVNAVVAVSSLSATNCSVNSMIFSNTTQAASGTGSHTHTLAAPLSGYVLGATVAFW